MNICLLLQYVTYTIDIKIIYNQYLTTYKFTSHKYGTAILEQDKSGCTDLWLKCEIAATQEHTIVHVINLAEVYVFNILF